MKIKDGLIYPEPWDETRCRVCGRKLTSPIDDGERLLYCLAEGKSCATTYLYGFQKRADAPRPITDTDRIEFMLAFGTRHLIDGWVPCDRKDIDERMESKSEKEHP